MGTVGIDRTVAAACSTRRAMDHKNLFAADAAVKQHSLPDGCGQRTPIRKEVERMALPESFLQQLKLSCDIESVISSYVTVKRAGTVTAACLCPISLRKNTVDGDLQRHAVLFIVLAAAQAGM